MDPNDEQAGRDTKANTVVTCGERLSQWSAQDTDNRLCILSDLAADITLDDLHRSIAYHERGLIYEKLDHYEEAVADFTRAIGLSSTFDAAIAGRGLAYQEMGRYEEALTDFTQAIELNPESQ